MRILFLTVDDETRASSRTRVYQFLPHLKEAGIEYDIVPWNGKTKYPIFKDENSPAKKAINLITSEVINYFVMTARISWALFNIKRYDLVFVQKITLRRLLLILRALKVKYIYDIDDAIYTLHSSDLAKSNKATRVNQAIEFMKTARHMIVELPSTEEVARHHCKNVTTILGPIDVNRYRPSREKDPKRVTIGWIGSLGNTFYLFEIKDVLEKICRENKNAEVALIGTRGFETSEPNIKLVKWSLETELYDLKRFDIGIMPLTDDEWSRGKGSYKLLQYMALGIPSVASPVGINTSLIKDGINGYLAKTPDEWESKLSLLINNDNLRKELGARAREMAVNNYSLEASVPKFVAAIRAAYNSK